MMRNRHVENAARDTLSILCWRVSKCPLRHNELLEAFDAIYQENDVGHQRSAPVASHGAQKAIVFEGVSLAYHHFCGRQPDIWQLRKYLREVGDHEDWGIIDLERNRPLDDSLVAVRASARA